ncbi:hypothetical protein SAMN05660860_03489 [Geoalkalibacter ferrihydriticus]|uniref:Uncharacterized protein n=2 Tax=Geoalkalibacter ferrihydriticus TaxID=392333 RepID=A0A0C2HM01_9BACT|nr:hypothetical protein [Geoalkalibacter ferrihydriticus]KIH76005.1 hypothetical protein GFER_14025 [Geoalkalibacter ferrihydriticus DSM 17813]SDM97471.1 hypothetical protein SAMN05660860_03489 [Geoalkalibacter ferrihydriticus]
MASPDRFTVPTIAEVERIAALSDPIIRNLQITQCYHELSLAYAARSFPGANWCAFGTWASRQAGQTIRQDDLQHTLERLIRSKTLAAQAARHLADVAQRFGARLQRDEILRVVWELVDPAAILARMSAEVAKGNKKIFEEIAREFARFLSLEADGAPFSPATMETFCAALRAGDPPQGQDYLCSAFTHYAAELAASVGKERAELKLLANIEIGYHEQTRAQPEIAAALNATVIDSREFTDRLLAAAFPRGSLLVTGRKLLMGFTRRPTPLQRAIDVFLEAVRRELRQIITDKLMVLELPDGRLLRMGADLEEDFPPQLKELSNPELRALLVRIDPTPDSLRQTGATDWAVLEQRVHFIVDLFRALHETPELFQAPYTPQQVGALKQGLIPEGRL